MNARANETRSTSIPSIEKRTGKAWSEWLAYFHEHGAAQLPHPEIAKLALANVPADLENPEWWAQGIAIAFEQQTGLRVPGQASDGTFRVGVSRTLPLNRDEAIELWISTHGPHEDHRGHAVTDTRNSRTAQRTFWRCTLEGAGRLEVAAADKDAERAVLTVELTRLADPDSIEEWRSYWKARLAELTVTG